MLTFSQLDLEYEIFKKVVYYETEKGTTELYFRCEKNKTFININDFKEESILQIPDSILTELEISLGKSFKSNWDKEVLEDIALGKLHHFEKCLTNDEVIELYNSFKKVQNILSISQPIFDSNKEHCLVNIGYSKFIGMASGHSYLLKKIYGKWIIIETFGHWMT